MGSKQSLSPLLLPLQRPLLPPSALLVLSMMQLTGATASVSGVTVFPQLGHPMRPHGFRLCCKFSWRKLDATNRWQLHLEGECFGGSSIFHSNDICTMNVCSCVVHEVHVLFGTVVHQAAVFCDPHVSFKPIFSLHAVTITL